MQNLLLQAVLAQLLLTQMISLGCAGHLRSTSDTARKLFLVSPSTSSSRDTCTTVSGPKAGSPCVFPFKFRDETYEGCTRVGSDDGEPWCSTQTDASGVHTQGNWGRCQPSCKKSLASTTAADYTNPSPIPGLSRWAFSEVPYVLPANTGSETLGEKVSRRRIEFAMAHYRRHTAVRFVKRTTQRNYVQFVWGGECSSWVGAQGGAQLVTLMRQSGHMAGCSVGDIVHELGHAIGFQHEHQRRDRDRYLAVDFANAKPDAKSLYARSHQAIDILEYDYGSIMHYERRGSLAVNPARDVLTPLRAPYEAWKRKWNNGNDVAVGQKDGLSHIDVRSVDELYGECIDEGVGAHGEDARWAAQCASPRTPWPPATPGSGSSSSHCWRVSEFGACSTHAPGDSFRPEGWAHTRDTCQPTHQHRKVFCVDAETGRCAPARRCAAADRPAASRECRHGGGGQQQQQQPGARSMSMAESLSCRFMEDTCFWQNGFYAFPEAMDSDLPFTLMAGNHYERTSPTGGVELTYGHDEDHLGYLLFNTKHLSAAKRRGERAHFVSPPVVLAPGRCLVFNHHLFAGDDSGARGVRPGTLRLERAACPGSAGGSSGSSPEAWTTLWDSDDAGVQSVNAWREVEVPLHALSEMGVSLTQLNKLAAQAPGGGGGGGGSRGLRGGAAKVSQRDRRLFFSELQEAESLDWQAAAAATAQQGAPDDDIWAAAAEAAGSAVGGSPAAVSSTPILQQLRFTAVVGSDPSRSDIGLDNLYVQDCSQHVTSAVRNAKLARGTAWS